MEKPHIIVGYSSSDNDDDGDGDAGDGDAGGDNGDGGGAIDIDLASKPLISTVIDLSCSECIAAHPMSPLLTAVVNWALNSACSDQAAEICSSSEQLGSCDILKNTVSSLSYLIPIFCRLFNGLSATSDNYVPGGRIKT